MWEIRSTEGSDSLRATPPDWDRKIGVRASALQPVPTPPPVVRNSIPSHSTERVGETRREGKTKRGEETANGFHASSSAPLLCCLLCLARRESGAPCQWVTDTQIHGSGRRRSNLSCLEASALPSPVSQTSLTPPEQGELTQLEQHQIGLFQTGRVRGGCFRPDCGSPGVCELLVDKHGRVCFVLGLIQASDHRKSATVKANWQMTTVNYVCLIEMKIWGDVKYIFLPLSHRLKLKHLPPGVFVYTFSGCASEFMCVGFKRGCSLFFFFFCVWCVFPSVVF